MVTVMQSMNERICCVWEEILVCRKKMKDGQKEDTARMQHSFQDIGFVISQLIEPTVSIIVGLATLYAVRDGNRTKTEADIEKKKTEIKEIFDNYNLDMENVDEVISEILSKL